MSPCFAALGSFRHIDSPGNVMNECARELALGAGRQLGGAVAFDKRQLIVVRFKTAARSSDKIGGDKIEILAFEFFARIAFDVVCLGGKADEKWTRRELR